MKNRFRGLSESRKLEMLQMSVEEIYNAGYVAGYTKKALKKQQDGVARVEPKSPNQLRAELIQRAREFEKEQKNDLKAYTAPNRKGCFAEFIINKEKRTVVVLLRGPLSQIVHSRGIAKCHPDEVFNEWIGKAIALARALEIEIPQEFMDAVQPDELEIGMVVEATENFNTVKIGWAFKVCKDAFYDCYSGKCAIGSVVATSSKIIDDTHAEYEVPSC